MAVNYQIAPWIRPPESLSQSYLSGLQIGAHISQQQAQLQQDAQMQALKNTLAQQQLQRESQIQMQRLEVEKSYRDQANSIAQQKLAEVQQVNQQKVQDAARKFQMQQAYTQRVLGGEDPNKVLSEIGFQMGAPSGAISEALRAGRGPSDMTAYQAAEIAQRKLEEQRRVKAAADKAAREGTKLSPPDAALLGADVTELKGLEKQIGGTEEHGFGVFHPFGGNKAQMDALRKKASDLRQHIKDTYGGSDKNVTAAPVNPDDRVAGKTYRTPKGLHTWTGKGWKVAETPAAPAADDTEEDTNAE